MEFVDTEVIWISILFFLTIGYFVYIWFLFAYKKYFRIIDNNGVQENAEEEQGRRINRRNRINHNEWSIWLNEFVNRVEITCSHNFWGQWLINIWEHTNRQIKCPLWRNTVNIIFLEFERNDENDQLVRKIRKYNRRYSNGRNIIAILSEAPYLLYRWITSIHGIASFLFSLRIFIIVLAAIFYVLFPFDIIPESMFGLVGLLDDIFIGWTFLAVASQIYINQYVENN